MIITECLEQVVKNKEAGLAENLKDDAGFTQLEQMIGQKINTSKRKW